ncbi:MAG: Wzz/FepE/Etk N-terminal domain-containing protein [Nitrospira sp.]|nr:Wzz/FepE/Etk N-terminal domain-containing protein [Nitrospira sp.]MCP9460745.1 Wzz/FepE/Etk N-terminal domain-containing protein [Nitrospira sp.]MCP9475516.1 Wzz/FepE/Etk N-terminal domain-containing protein [Nitrospira sp.]
MNHTSLNLQQIGQIVRRRRVPMIVVTTVIFLASVAVAYLWPPVYKSTATILIEEQEIPADIVRSAITSYADQRIETIKQQVMTRSTLMKFVDEFGLYKKLRQTGSTEEVLERFTDDIRVEVMNVKIIDKRTQTPTQATIAFTLSYEGESPQIAQKVANELTSLFLGENLKTRERHAQETTEFLKKEEGRLAQRIREIQEQLSAVKQRAEGALPELTSLNMTMLNQAERELLDIDREIRSWEERKTYLEGELATLKPNTPIIAASGERILDSSERLRALRAQYASMTGYLSPEHPDVIQIQQQIAALERDISEQETPEELQKRLTGERARLATLLDTYGDEHPDVIQARRSIASLEQELDRVGKAGRRKAEVKPENPAYINIQAQLATANSSLQALKKSREGIKKRVSEYAKRIEQAVHVEPTYLDLVRNREEAIRKHEEITSRLLEAEVSKELEIQRKGERFSLIDPPDLPEKPEKPNRPVIMILGLILALGGGAGSGALFEQLDRSIRGERHLGAVAGLPPLAVIPYLANEDDLRRFARRRYGVAAAGIGVVVLLAVSVHVLFYPLDVIWYAAMRKLGLT